MRRLVDRCGARRGDGWTVEPVIDYRYMPRHGDGLVRLTLSLLAWGERRFLPYATPGLSFGFTF